MPFSDDNDTPIAIQLCVRGILDAQSATSKEEIDLASASWEGDIIENSKFADNLMQVRCTSFVYIKCRTREN